MPLRWGAGRSAPACNTFKGLRIALLWPASHLQSPVVLHKLFVGFYHSLHNCLVHLVVVHLWRTPGMSKSQTGGRAAGEHG